MYLADHDEITHGDTELTISLTIKRMDYLHDKEVIKCSACGVMKCYVQYSNCAVAKITEQLILPNTVLAILLLHIFVVCVWINPHGISTPAFSCGITI